MTPDEFADGLDRWGGSLTDWPPQARRAAETLLADDAAARAALAAMMALEAGLRRTAYRPAAGAMDHIAARAMTRRQDSQSAPVRLRVGAVLGALLMAACGFAYGALHRPRAQTDWFAGAIYASDPFDAG